MKNTVYDVPSDIVTGTSQFKLTFNETGQIMTLWNPGDPDAMNWIHGRRAFGSIVCDKELSVRIHREFLSEGVLRETYLFYNETPFPIYAQGTELGICLAVPDYYTDAGVCFTHCCHTHLWCGGSSSWMMALKMSGGRPNLGLILREGSLSGYSIERPEFFEGAEGNISNTRGDFIVHPENLVLLPGESYRLTWDLFWFDSKDDFRKLLAETPGFVGIDAGQYLLAGTKNIRFSFTVGGLQGVMAEGIQDQPKVLRDGEEISYTWRNGRGCVSECADHYGEYRYQIEFRGRRSSANFYAMPDVISIAKKRCSFIADFQQCTDQRSDLYGAYLIFDNETGCQYYDHQNDHNGGRERVGMGVVTAVLLNRLKNQGAAGNSDAGQCLNSVENVQNEAQDSDKALVQKLGKSLNLYLSYVLRCLYDEKTGEVYNDAPRCNDYSRLYNYPWMCSFFLELFRYTGDSVFLDRYFLCAMKFYQEGGAHFYAIGMPMTESVQLFRKAGRISESDCLLAMYQKHADFILSRGTDYPKHEVAYEQSIVAPAAIYLEEMFLLTREEKYQKGAEEQLKVLDLFEAFQPDYHLYETAIRHWDGYWFGKRKCLGDTFPHYWTALSGYAFMLSKEVLADTSDERKVKSSVHSYSEKAEASLKAALSLFHEDGSASCANIFPMSVNGRPANFQDPWANDQDWELYYAMKYLNTMTDGHRMRGFGYMAVPAECSVNKTIQQKGKIMKFID